MLARVDVMTSISQLVDAFRSWITAVRVGSSIATTSVLPTRATGTTSERRAKRGLISVWSDRSSPIVSRSKKLMCSCRQSARRTCSSVTYFSRTTTSPKL